MFLQDHHSFSNTQYIVSSAAQANHIILYAILYKRIYYNSSGSSWLAEGSEGLPILTDNLAEIDTEALHILNIYRVRFCRRVYHGISVDIYGGISFVGYLV